MPETCPWNGIRLRTMDDCTCKGRHPRNDETTESEGNR